MAVIVAAGVGMATTGIATSCWLKQEASSKLAAQPDKDSCSKQASQAERKALYGLASAAEGHWQGREIRPTRVVDLATTAIGGIWSNSFSKRGTCLEFVKDGGDGSPAEAEESKVSTELQIERPLGHGLRGFLIERSSGKYLTVVEGTAHALTVVEGTPHATCMLTDRAASLLICRCSEEANANWPIPVAFQHEGIPALDRFLSCKAPLFLQREEFLPLKCAGRGHSGNESLLYYPDSTLQHRSTGYWLWAETGTGKIGLHASEKTKWDIVPAV